MSFAELRKGSASRKFGYNSAARSHRRGAAFSLIGGFPAMGEEGESNSPLTSKSSSASGSAGYRIDLDYSCRKLSKTSTGKKGHKVRVH
jgi:hypothetical protein